MKYDLNEIFTPTSPAVYTFVNRPTINDQLVEALKTKGKQLILYGHSGTGKTTLLHNKLNQTYDDFIVTRCTSDLTFDQLILNAFDQLNKFFISTKEFSKSSKISSDISGDYLLLKGKVGIEIGSDSQVNLSRIVPPQLTPQKLASFFGSSNSCWVIEDFHKMNKDEKKILAQYMKVFMDESINYPYVKIIAVGAVNKAHEVLELDRELNNRVAEIQVPFMSDNELNEILVLGESKMNISINREVKDKIIKYSSGLPAITHQLAYNLCSYKSIYETSDIHITIDHNDLRDALGNYIVNNSAHLHDRYEKSTMEPTVNHVPIFYHIIRCFVLSKTHKLSLKNVKKYFLDNKHPQSEGLLEHLLMSLTKESKGYALDFDQLTETWSMTDPFFKVYCSCMISLTKQNLQAQLDLFSIESIEKSKQKLRNREKELVRKMLESGENLDF